MVRRRRAQVAASIAAHSSTTAVVAAAAARESPWVPLAPNVGDQGPASADRGGQQAGPADRPVPHGGIDKETGGQPTGGEGDADEEKPALKRSSSRRATRRLEGGRHRGGGGAGGEGEFPFRLVAVLRHDVPVDQVDPHRPLGEEGPEHQAALLALQRHFELATGAHHDGDAGTVRSERLAELERDHIRRARQPRSLGWVGAHEERMRLGPPGPRG